MAFAVPQYPAQIYTLQPQNQSSDEEPLYVNAKQYNRILKRRAIRAKLEAELKAQRARKVNQLFMENRLLIMFVFSHTCMNLVTNMRCDVLVVLVAVS